MKLKLGIFLKLKELESAVEHMEENNLLSLKIRMKLRKIRIALKYEI